MGTARTFLLSALAIAAALAATPAQVSGSAGGNRFGGNLCAIASASALRDLKISGPCVRRTTVSKAQSTPYGTVRSVTYQAYWGTFGSISAPTYHAAFTVIHVQGSAAAVAYLKARFRSEVLGNGAPVRLKPLMTEAGDTAACHNPPIDDCTQAEVMAIVGQYGVVGTYYGPAKFVGEDDPQKPSVDETNDAAQEEAVKSDVVALANSIIAAL